MALYHFHVTQVSRGKGSAVVASAAYRAGEKLHDDYYGKDHDYTHKGGVVYTEIMAPDYVPARLLDRETLWNEVEAIEKHPKAQLAYNFDFALQNELPMDVNIEMARRFIKEQFVDRGMIADMAVHNPEKNRTPNPHVHVLCPIRPVGKDGTWGAKQKRQYLKDRDGNPALDDKGKQKFNAVSTTDWGKPETLIEWRRAWEKIVNDEFAKREISASIDHRSYAESGMELIPQIHEGPAVRQMEAKGIKTEKGEVNREIRRINSLFRKIIDSIGMLADWVGRMHEAAVREREEKKLDEKYDLPTLISNATIFREYDRITWNSKARHKCHNRDQETYRRFRKFIEENKIYTFFELNDKLIEYMDKADNAKQIMHQVKDKIRTIEKLENAYGILCELKPVHDTYVKLRWKGKKDKYWQEHSAELKKYNSAARYLNEHCPGGHYDQASVDDAKAAFAVELAEEQAHLSEVRAKLDTLEQIRKYINRMLPKDFEKDQERRKGITDESVRKKLKDLKEQITEDDRTHPPKQVNRDKGREVA